MLDKFVCSCDFRDKSGGFCVDQIGPAIPVGDGKSAMALLMRGVNFTDGVRRKQLVITTNTTAAVDRFNRQLRGE